MQIQINLNLNHKGCKIKRNKNIEDVVWVINLSLNRKRKKIKIKPNFVDVIVIQPKKTITIRGSATFLEFRFLIFLILILIFYF